MNKSELQARLRENHSAFTAFLQGLDSETFIRSNNGKWTPAQQLDHIRRSVQPVKLAFGLPKFVLKLVFGTANRPSRSYAEVVAKYQARLQSGGRASGRFVPPAIAASQQKALTTSVMALTEGLCRTMDGYTEQQLDTLILPHPLLGKLTLREMLYFTIYHVEHHLVLTKRDLGA